MTVHCKLNVQHTTYCVQVIFYHRSGMVRSVYSVTTSQKDFQVVLPIYMQSIWSCCQSFLNYEREFSVPDIDALVNISFASFHRLYFVIASILSNSFSLSSFFFFPLFVSSNEAITISSYSHVFDVRSFLLYNLIESDQFCM